ncbi:REC8 meiotic recombination protein b [Erpetoichthys calabaricus]|uniref:REC8 meiotic recombination protein b n=1 Tax=Erpetoichthys calabaricus TaxID=27687 RepID=UPI002234787A|nr:REC8 meiotic recombination protein b [Erpetoichthys calabaricus]
MFYYPNVLQRKTGCFSTIWQAATRGTQVKRREYLKVNIGKTCEDIIQYILVQVEAPIRSLPRPRFSLYLSSMLQYGVVVVYHKHCNYLLEEMHNILERLLRYSKQLKIDMVELERANLNVPDRLSLMEVYEGAFDPFFGIMSSSLELPSPMQLPHLKHMLVSATPELHREMSPVTSPPLSVSMQPVTLKEPESIAVLPTEEEKDLDEITEQELEFFMQQDDNFITKEDEKIPRARPEKKKKPAKPAKVEQLLQDLLSETLPLSQDISHLDEIPKRPEAQEPPEFFPEETPLSLVSGDVTIPTPIEAPTAISLPVPPTELSPPEEPPRRRSRRQLIFADVTTQIPPEEFRQQIENPAIQTQALSKVLIQDPRHSRIMPIELFTRPGYRPLPPAHLQELWNRCAVVTPLDHTTKRKRLITEEEEESEIEIFFGDQEPSIPPLEITVPPGVLEASGEERSYSFTPPEAGRSPAKSVLSRAESHLAVLEDIPEEISMLEQPEILVEEPLTPENLYRLIAQHIEQYGETYLDQLVPPGSPRRMACMAFSTILVLKQKNILHLVQAVPYGRILIQPGPLYQDLFRTESDM